MLPRLFPGSELVILEMDHLLMVLSSLSLSGPSQVFLWKIMVQMKPFLRSRDIKVVLSRLTTFVDVETTDRKPLFENTLPCLFLYTHHRLRIRLAQI